jgi:hypothetical protein
MQRGPRLNPALNRALSCVQLPLLAGKIVVIEGGRGESKCNGNHAQQQSMPHLPMLQGSSTYEALQKELSLRLVKPDDPSP